MAAKDVSDDTDAPANAPTGEAPILDMSQASIKRLIAKGKERGTITYDELNRVLPWRRGRRRGQAGQGAGSDELARGRDDSLHDDGSRPH